MARIHHLKSWPEPFAAVKTGLKSFEIRKDDRGFMVGDFLCLREWDPGKEKPDHALRGSPLIPVGEYTGQEVWVKVQYKTSGGSWGLPPGLCVLGIWLAGEPSQEPPMEVTA
jgi:hypothetical protein